MVEKLRKACKIKEKLPDSGKCIFITLIWNIIVVSFIKAQHKLSKKYEIQGKEQVKEK